MKSLIFPALSVIGFGIFAGFSLVKPKAKTRKAPIASMETNVPVAKTESQLPINVNQSLPAEQQRIYIIDDDQDKFTGKVGIFEGMEQSYNDGLYKGRVRIGNEYTTLDHLIWAPIDESVRKNPVDFAMMVALVRAQKAYEKRVETKSKIPFGASLN